MSSETSTKAKKKPAAETEPVDERVAGFQPWHLFVIGTLMASAATGERRVHLTAAAPTRSSPADPRTYGNSHARRLNPSSTGIASGS